MAGLKTKQNNASVEGFIKKVKNKKRQEDAFAVLEMMKAITDENPKMWGPSIVGFGSYHYKYETGREGDMPIIGFSPRAQSLTLYVLPGADAFPELMDKLGRYKTGKSCLYINKLEDVDTKVLQKIITKSVQHTKKKYKV
jgi:hypothetical protein